MKIIKKGLLASFQDLGQNGLRHLGVNPSGVMDKLTARLLNILLQNDENTPVLEMYFPAPEILFEEDSIIVIGGANFTPMVDNQSITNNKCIFIKSGSTLKFKKKISGNIAYLAKKSVPTNHFLPYLGNSFVAQVSNLSDSTKIRFIKGNEHRLLTEKSKQNLESQNFTITQNSNRMGFRMNAERLELAASIELISTAVDYGTMQLLTNGQLIILMADHQTSGGYPRIGNVVSTDLPILAQCGANDIIKFEAISIEKAEKLLILQEKEIIKLKSSVKLLYKNS